MIYIYIYIYIIHDYLANSDGWKKIIIVIKYEFACAFDWHICKVAQFYCEYIANSNKWST